jgi:anti-sigma regulatory factor (Ser/Thr protein kinase)
VIGPEPALCHQAAIYRTDAELVDAALPKLREWVGAGDSTLLAVGPRERALLLDALGGDRGVTTLDAAGHYQNPFRTLEATYRLVHELGGEGRAPVRVVGQIPDPAGRWDGWARYEAAFNHICAPLDVWALCLYDARSTPVALLDDVRCTHPQLVGGADSTAGADGDGGPRTPMPNPSYVEPLAFLDERARLGADPMESGPPHLTRHDPTPAEARRAVADLAEGTALGKDATDRLVLAVSELVTNASTHGRPPVVLRAWSGGDRLVVSVTDAGPGPADPFVGFMPRRGGIGGMGLWIVNQACSSVGFLSGRDGFTVRVTARAGG